jgi:hypothetical protein
MRRPKNPIPICLCVIAFPLRAQTPAPPTLAQLITSQLPAIRSSTTLGAWKLAHRGDRAQLYDPFHDDQSHGAWCAHSDAEIPIAGGRVARRMTWFYPPAAPADLAFPVRSTTTARGDACRAGYLWITVHDRDTKQIDVLKRATESALTTAAGAPDAATKISGMGSAWWLEPKWRRVDGVELVTAAIHQRYWPKDGSRIGDSTGILVGLATPVSYVSFREEDWVRFRTEEEEEAEHRLSQRIDEAIRIAAVGGSVGAEFDRFRILSGRGATRDLTDSERVAFGAAMERWLDAAAKLPVPRRAAALLAADDVLSRSGGSAGWADSEHVDLRRRFRARGAVFNYLELGGGFDYSHTWLKDARRIAPESRAGELAFLTLAERGFETTGGCGDQNGEGFRAVIARVEPYLRAHPDSPIQGELHLLLAQAYGDIVALASGAGYDANEDSAVTIQYRPQEPRARRRAIEEYRIAVPLLGKTPRAEWAWTEAWRLVEGVAPSRTRFYCVYD